MLKLNQQFCSADNILDIHCMAKIVPCTRAMDLLGVLPWVAGQCGYPGAVLMPSGTLGRVLITICASPKYVSLCKSIISG